MAGNTGKAVWEGIVNRVDIGAAEVVGLVRAPEGDGTCKILYNHIPEAAGLFSPAMTKPHKNSVSGILCVNSIDNYIFQRSTIDCFQRHCRAEGVAHPDVPYPDIAEAAKRFRTHLQSIGA